MPGTKDQFAARTQISIELLRKRQAHVRATIPIAEDAVALSHDKAMEAARLHLQHEIARAAVGYILKRREADTGRRFDQPLARVHAV